MKYVLLFLQTVVMVLCLFSCKTTSTEKCTVTGTLHIDGMQDGSGITVCLYENCSNEVSAVIAEKIEEHPNIGYNLDSSCYFDHRVAQALALTLTDANGNFSFTGIDKGAYHMVFYKEGYGVRYLEDVDIESADFNITAVYNEIDLTLYSMIDVPQNITSDYVFLSDRSYLINGNTISIQNATLTFQANSRIYFSAGSLFTIYGNALFPVNLDCVHFTSLSNIYTSSNQQVTKWGGVVFRQGGIQVHNIQCSFLYDSLSIRANSINVFNTSVVESSVGISLSDCSDIEIRNCIFLNHNSQITDVAVKANSMEYLNIHENIFVNNNNSLVVEFTSDHVISDNLFIGCTKSIQSIVESSGIVEYNEFEDVQTAIENAGRANLTCSNNNIEAGTCIRTYVLNSIGNTATTGWTVCHLNNFIASSLAVEARAQYGYVTGTYYMNCENNFWNTTEQEQIDSLIIDKNDLGSGTNPEYVYAEVDYSPFRTGLNQQAGIRQR